MAYIRLGCIRQISNPHMEKQKQNKSSGYPVITFDSYEAALVQIQTVSTLKLLRKTLHPVATHWMCVRHGVNVSLVSGF